MFIGDTSHAMLGRDKIEDFVGGYERNSLTKKKVNFVG
jgi:hypothetical protein